jgi:hypothetical protein
VAIEGRGPVGACCATGSAPGFVRPRPALSHHERRHLFPALRQAQHVRHRRRARVPGGHRPDRGSGLPELGPPAPDADEFYRLDIGGCTACGATNALDVKHVTRSVDAEGGASTVEIDVIEYLLLTRAEAQRVRALERRGPTSTERRRHMSSAAHYQHSGRFEAGGVFTALLFMILLGSLAAAAYAYLILYIPFIYINALLTIGFGGVLAATAYAGAQRGRIRARGIVLAAPRWARSSRSTCTGPCG